MKVSDFTIEPVPKKAVTGFIEKYHCSHYAGGIQHKQCFALLRRCYALGMLIVNNVDLKSAYSCLRANPKSNWENKIMELLGNPLDLSKYLPSDEPQSYRQETILNLYQLKEIKIINPLPEIVWRDETDEYYWMPHQYSNFIYKEEFDEYVDAELLATLQNKKKMRKRKGMKAQDELRGKDFMKELMNQASGTR